MRLLSGLLIVFVVCLAAMALPTAPAQAQGAYITLSPSSGVPGEEVTIRGYNFTASTWVDIYYYRTSTARIWLDDIRTTSTGGFNVTFTVPESYTGAHKVRAEITSTSYADADFTVHPGLTVSPEEGPVGTNVTVEGHGFAVDEEDIELWYDDKVIKDDITAEEDGSWQHSFQIPRSIKGNHKIDAKGEESSFAQVTDAIFKVTPGISLDKSSGSPGDTIIMTGSGFGSNERDINILFAGAKMQTNPEIPRADSTGYWQASFVVPEKPKATYSVTAEGELTLKEAITALSFALKPDLALSPDEGHVGTELTVAGRGFAANKDVVIKYDGSQKATARTNTIGSFSGASFPVPEGIHGTHQVKAEDAVENEATATFTMESVPPATPELISPPDGGRIGFIGMIRPTLGWSEVSDDSGVYYNLQIAASANVTATGEFADPIVSKEGLVGTNYTLEKAEALPYGTYYWIVQAIDGAENESDWTEVYSFGAGLLPLWAFIVIIVAIVVLVGALVYFRIIRRRIRYY